MHNTLLVVDQPDSLEDCPFERISFDRYLSEYPKLGEQRTRVINLCDTDPYLSRGYYCSLLAEARQHKVIPGVITINDLRTADASSAGSLNLRKQHMPALADKNPQTEWVFFGWTAQESWRRLAQNVFERYPAPLLRVTLKSGEGGVNIDVKRGNISELDDQTRQVFYQRLQVFIEQVWRRPVKRRAHRWDMAILVDPEEKTPPSDEEAISRFVKAAHKVGIQAEILTPDQTHAISQFDALFIRQTTAIDHPTYRLARRAEREGLVTIDDSTSILRCCNKVFLHDAFSYNRVPAPRTSVVSSVNSVEIDRLEAQFGYPMVLKMPEGSFSLGVFKVEDRNALVDRLNTLFEQSALVLVQEYLFTDYDWRIGVLNGRPIYACRYFMARNHWQIYNHQSGRNFSGGYDTLPTFEVPRKVLDAAIKAAGIIGKGLYGVDLKHKDNKVYVIEVNDNPSIEHDVEDKYLGNEIYMLVMQEFARRLEQRGR